MVEPPPITGNQPTFPPPPPTPWKPKPGADREEWALDFLMYLGTQALASRVYVERLYFLLTQDERVRENVESIPDREPYQPPPEHYPAGHGPVSGGPPPPPPEAAGVFGSIGVVSDEMLREHGRDLARLLIGRLFFGPR